jgi:hypothetical protein
MKRLLTLSAVLLTFAGCQTQMEVPEGFVRLEQPGRYDVKAISPDGVSVSARRIDVPDDSTLDFWVEAVGNELTAGGYTHIQNEDVTDAAGHPGRLLWFDRELEGRRYTYVTGLYTLSNRLLVAEAGGPADAFETRRKAIRESLLSVR